MDTRVNGRPSMMLAIDFLSVAAALDAKDQNDIPKEVLEGAAAMRKAAEFVRGNPTASALARLFPALMANPAETEFPTPKTSGKRNKKQ
jgi:hypothetical protein